MKYILDICNDGNVGKVISFNGWIKKIRKTGSLIFMDVYDTSGYVQVIVNDSNPCFEIIEKLPKESVVAVKGELVERKSKNEKIPTGDYEVALSNIKIYSISEIPPLLIQDDTDALEDTRLKYRYLDLRRPSLHNNIKFRSKFLFEARKFLQANKFIEIETPYLSKQTPEGARDYLVPTRSGNFFALPQSPQIFKQLLMVSGFMRYFQIFRCFRDEDLRADRQPEFTQLDMEFSFVNEEIIFKYIEKLFNYLLKKTMNVSIPEKFQRMSYKQAFEEYGSDKPDLRYGFKIIDVKDIFANSDNNEFKNYCDKDHELKAIIFNDLLIKENDYKTLEKYAKDNGSNFNKWITFDGNNVFNKSILNEINIEDVKAIFNKFNVNKGTLFIIGNDYETVHKALGAVRTATINYYNIQPEEEFKFVWIIDWPLYEYSKEENRYMSAHHPFTHPTLDCINSFDTDKENAKARSYDLVLNGYEIGGGSIRIHDADLQRRVFKSLGLSDDEIDNKFGFMINAFKYGVPPHGGIALGVERILMILLKTETIRDVIAFPKNSSGSDIMQGCPCNVEDELLEELHLVKKDGKNK